MVSFIVYDLIFLVLFTLLVILFLYSRRKNLQREGLLYLYRTQIGVKIIDYVGKKYKKTLTVLSYLSVITGYILMISMIFLFAQITYTFYKLPEVVRAIKVPPILPLIPYLPELFKIEFLPPLYFTFWIIMIAIVAIPHEFAHGIFARFYNVEVKSTGFGFLGPFLAAFVEPNEEEMKKKKIFNQLAILSSGTFANVLTALIFFIIIVVFFISAFTPSGVLFTTYYYNDSINLSQISSINGMYTYNLTDIQKINLIENTFQKVNESNISVNSQQFIILKNYSNPYGDYQYMKAFYFSAALKNKLNGAITSINGVSINSKDKLSQEILKYKPGDEIKITTIIGSGKKQNYSIILGENPQDKNKPFLGIVFEERQPRGFLGKIYKTFASFKDPQIYYEPKLGEFTLFIYNLLWWIILAAIGVALTNMLPLGIFDGGRVFYLSILGITKSEKIAKRSYVLITYLLLLILILLMFFWFKAIFL